MSKPTLTGLLKHANVCRWLLIHRLHPYQFYVIARLCQTHLPAPSIQTIARETRRQSDEARGWILKLERAGILRVDRSNKSEYKLEPTLEGWKFYYLVLADMEAPITDSRVFSTAQWYPKRRVRSGKSKGKRMNWPHGARSKANKLGALPKKPGRSIWEQSGLPPIPKFQRRKHGSPKSSAQASAPSPSTEPSGPEPKP